MFYFLHYLCQGEGNVTASAGLSLWTELREMFSSDFRETLLSTC